METDTLGIDLTNPSTPCHGFIRRPAMARLARLVSAAGAAVLIAACGGGGGGGAIAPDSTTDKYIGIWNACVVSGTESILLFLRFAKIDAKRATFFSTATLHANANCTSPQSILASTEGTGVIDGTTTVQSTVVDKITITDSTGPLTGIPFKDIALVNGNQLQFGNSADTDPKDPDGYPTTLNTIVIFIRQ